MMSNLVLKSPFYLLHLISLKAVILSVLACSLAVRPQKSWGKYYKSWGKHILMCLVFFFFFFFFLQSDTRRHNDFCFLAVRSHQMEKVTKKHYCPVLSCSQITLNTVRSHQMRKVTKKHYCSLLFCSQTTSSGESHKGTLLLSAFLESGNTRWGSHKVA